MDECLRIGTGSGGMSGSNFIYSRSRRGRGDQTAMALPLSRRLRCRYLGGYGHDDVAANRSRLGVKLRSSSSPSGRFTPQIVIATLSVLILKSLDMRVLSFGVCAFTTILQRPTTAGTVSSPSPSSPSFVLRSRSSSSTATTSDPITSSPSPSLDDLIVDENIGSGSYGTVHFLRDGKISGSSKNGDGWYVGKRPWSIEELKERNRMSKSSHSSSCSEDTTNNSDTKDPSKDNEKFFQERQERCEYYWNVEAHCLAKIPPHPQIPTYFGTRKSLQDASGLGKEQDWMVFGFVGDDGDKLTDDERPGSASSSVPCSRPRPAPTLQDLMDIDHEQKQHHTLSNIATCLGIDNNGIIIGDSDGDYGGDTHPSSYSETLDTVLPSLMTVLDHVHAYRVVHRDVKPSNLLVHKGTLLLMDFGSAADLDPSTPNSSGGGFMSGLQKKRLVGLEDPSRVAVSPIYAAPETFIDVHNSPTEFDIFSSALIFCQLLFGYLEDRVDAGFHQQLKDSGDGTYGWNLNVWLYNELGTRLRPVGLDQALSYLSERRGLWKLLSEMLSEDPSRRPSAKRVLKRWKLIQQDRVRRQSDTYDETATTEEQKVILKDNPFFEMVVDALEVCEIPSVSRALHYVVTFSRSESLGLVLSEADESGDDAKKDAENDKDEVSLQNSLLWKEATSDASPGEVFVRDILPGSQADGLGTIQIGDRLSGIGELPFIDGGFEKALAMLQDQPKAVKNIRLHFDRKSVRSLNDSIDIVPTEEVSIGIVDVGAWSSKGRRSTQEDAFVVHEIHDVKDRAVLIAGVMDGHGGTAASLFVSNELPNLLMNGLVIQDRQRSVRDALKDSWKTVCMMYQQRCLNDENQECIAFYDVGEGFLDAETGSQDIVAGTTCSLVALDETNGELTVLNCGDSRTVIVDSTTGKVRFASSDHTPQTEEERLLEGIENGLDYSRPQCRLSRWWLKVGDYEYAVGRSLEGPLATSKGIVSDADISTFLATPGDIFVSATDGVFDVIDSNEIAIELSKMRKSKLSARDTARAICAMAVRKGSTDNVSASVVFL